MSFMSVNGGFSFIVQEGESKEWIHTLLNLQWIMIENLKLDHLSRK